MTDKITIQTTVKRGCFETPIEGTQVVVQTIVDKNVKLVDDLIEQMLLEMKARLVLLKGEFK